MGPAWARSSALPCGTTANTCTSTTSSSSFSTAYWATVAPTFPAPTTVILGRAPILSPYRLQLRHVLDDGGAELRALHFLGPLHQPREVVGDHLGLDRLLPAAADPVRRVGPAHVAEHHLARQQPRPRVPLVLLRAFPRRPL